MAAAFDTQKAYRELTESDCFSPDQAERLVTLVNSVIVGNVGSKSNLENPENKLKLEMDVNKQDTVSKLNGSKNELKIWIISAVALWVVLIKVLDYLLSF